LGAPQDIKRVLKGDAVNISTSALVWLALLSAWHPSEAKALSGAENSSRASQHESWAASWAAAPAFAVGPEFGNQTIRQVVRLSAGGDRIRVRFTNENNADTLVIGAAHLAKPGPSPGSIDPATDRVLTFSGQTGTSVPAGAPVYSDPVDLAAAPLATYTISVYLKRHTGPSTIHPDGNATAYISEEGDFTGASIIPRSTTSTSRIFLSEVDVACAKKPMATIVTLGDSITDGANSTLDGNRRWPDRLAERLMQMRQLDRVGVANMGIGGNRILHDLPEASYGPSVLARLDRDVLSVPNLKWVILLEGINDIAHSTAAGLPDQAVSAEQIIAGMRQIIERVGGRGAKIAGATLTPFEGTIYSDFYTVDGEAKRQAVNRWIRTGKAFDAVIDFDAAVRDPAHPGRLRAEFDSGDHVHPNDDGYRRMADAIDLALFQ
jgi:lysophospholipase L1-like esterase